jgi:hypothetical protein
MSPLSSEIMLGRGQVAVLYWAFNASPAWLRTNTEIMLDQSRKARAALRNTARVINIFQDIVAKN